MLFREFFVEVVARREVTDEMANTSNTGEYETVGNFGKGRNNNTIINIIIISELKCQQIKTISRHKKAKISL